MAGDVMAIGGKTLTVFLAADLRNFNRGLNDADRGLRGFANGLKNNLGPAALGAAGAVAGLAVAMAVDGVKAAIEDEKAQATLAKTLENVGLAHDTAPIEEYISSLERSLGIADDELRPAYDRLIRSTNDTGKANKLLSLALDISAGTGKDLKSVVEALGKAYDGNTAGLARLGAGIDSAILKTGDMELITQTLAGTFGGQAAISAGTFEGQIRVLNIAVDNLKEAFGRGLLNAFEAAAKNSETLSKKMQELEDEAEGIGETIGTVALSVIDLGGSFLSAWSSVVTFNRDLQNSNNIFQKALGYLNPFNVVSLVLGDNLNDVADGADEAGTAIEGTGADAQTAAGGFSALTYQVGMSTSAYATYVQAHAVGRKIIQNANLDYKDLAARQQEVNKYESIGIDTTSNLSGARGAGTVETNKYAKAQEFLTEAFKGQSAAVKQLSTQLQTETENLAAAVAQVNDYAASIQENLLSGLDLGSAYTSQFDETGKRTGQGVVQGFTKMVEQANWFGNVLNALKAQGVDQSLIQYLASQGPEVGGALGQEMLGDKGLLSSLNEQWVNVQNSTKTLAMGLVPEFMKAGVESGIETVNGLADSLAEQTGRLGRIGKNIAKPVGARFKAQLLADIAAAVAEVEAIQAAARAEKVAAARSREAGLTEQAVAQALKNLVSKSDSRIGVNAQPVLA